MKSCHPSRILHSTNSETQNAFIFSQNDEYSFQPGAFMFNIQIQQISLYLCLYKLCMLIDFKMKWMLYTLT